MARTSHQNSKAKNSTAIIATIPSIVTAIVLVSLLAGCNSAQTPNTQQADPAQTETTAQVDTEIGEADQSPLEPIPDYQWQDLTRFSSGERPMLAYKPNPDRDRGIEAFAEEDYATAIEAFQQAVRVAVNDPEPQIYLSNAQAQTAGTEPYKLAAVVPITSRVSSAEEMLRGVADAQYLFNQTGGHNGRLLEVVIVNDSNNAEDAERVAQELALNGNILGIIGHNSSNTSKSGLETYNRANLAMVSPTSTSTALQGTAFFRTVPSDAAAGRKLADYMSSQGIQEVLVFYDSGSVYSQSLKQAFEQNFPASRIGGALPTLDLADQSIDWSTTLPGSIAQHKSQALLLLPSTKTYPTAITVANNNIQLAKPLPLFGGDALYRSELLLDGKQAANGMVLAVAWFANTPYAKKARGRWGGQVSWRTANSFDATQALVEALKVSNSREQVLEQLRSVQLSATQTAGKALKFDANGDRVDDPVLVQVVQTQNSVGFGFELLVE